MLGGVDEASDLPSVWGFQDWLSAASGAIVCPPAGRRAVDAMTIFRARAGKAGG